MEGRSDFFAELAQNISYEALKHLNEQSSFRCRDFYALLCWATPILFMCSTHLRQPSFEAEIEQKAQRQVSEGEKDVKNKEE